MISPIGTKTTTGSRAAPAAFTLLELIAVMVLISTVLALAAPSLRGFVHGRKTADAAADLLALTRLARSRAISQGTTVRLNFDTKEGTYWLTAQRGGAFVDLEDDFGRLFSLPTGVTVDLDLDVAEAPDEPAVAFYADGRCDPAVIALTGAQGEVLRVACPSAAERFRVVTETGEVSP